jgi:membrane-bound lytic murein transglycosylase A
MRKSQSRRLLPDSRTLLAVLLSGCGTTREDAGGACPARKLSGLPAMRAAGAALPPATASRPLQAARWSDLPGWSDDDLAAAWPAFLQSCRALASRPQWPQWKAVCAEARALNGPSTAAVRRFFESPLPALVADQSDGSSERSGDRLLRTAAARLA